MSGIAVYSEWLGNWGPHRARDLHAEGTINAVYALVWPPNAAAKANAAAWEMWRAIYPGPLWAWMNCSKDQAEDAFQLAALDAALKPDGWLLDIEGEWTKGAKLDTIVRAAKATGKPVRASLAGYSASHVEYDYRRLDAAVEWQAYADSGEGPDPETAVRELYESSFVIPGWEYRSWVRLPEQKRAVYGWGKIGSVDGAAAWFDSYRRPNERDAYFIVSAREWGFTVKDHVLWPTEVSEPPLGRLLGRARYSKIRVALIVSEEIEQRRTLAEWTAYAASARMPGMAKRPISVYLAERASDDVLRAVAKGAG